MNLIDLQIALRNLAQHSKRTLFLGVATGAVAALLLGMTGLIDGIDTTILRSASTFMTGHVNVGGFFKPSAGQSAPMVSDYETVLAQVKGQVPELDFVVVRGRGYAKSVSANASMDVVLGGIDIDAEPAFREVVRVVEGSLDGLKEPNSILLFEAQAKRLQVKVGDALTLSAPTARGMSNTADVRIVAIGKDVGLLSTLHAYIPAGTLRNLYNLKANTTGAIHLYLKNHADSPAVAARLRTALGDAGHRVREADPQPYFMKLMNKGTREDWTGQKLDVTTWQDEMSFMSQILTVLKALRALLVGILSVIVVVGIMTTMWIAIRERTREVGTLRAIGMQRRQVLKMFLLEASLLGLLGTLAGASVATVVALALNAAQISVPEAMQMFLMADSLWLEIRPNAFLTAVGSVTFVTIAAAIVPSVVAARLKPVTAMHHIG